MNKVIAVASMSAALALGLGACGSSGSDPGGGTQTHKAAKKTSDPCITASDYDKCAGSTPPTEDKPAKGHSGKPGRVKLAHKIENKLDIKGMGFPCKWKKQDNGSSAIVYTELCDKHQMMLVTNTSYSGISVWVDSMNDKLDQGWVLQRKHYALMSPDHGTINRAYDLLGAKGDVKSLG
ncbi:MAG: hypothetical protein ACRDMV_03855 [Streptosporangiales bacterium]